jgi:hypothetical protein
MLLATLIVGRVGGQPPVQPAKTKPVESLSTASAPKPVLSPVALPSLFKLLRYEEDWSALRDSINPLNWLKYVPLRDRDQWYLSVGGELRLRYEQYTNIQWGQNEPGTDGYGQQRYLLHTDWRLGRHLRVFGQLSSSLENGRRGKPLPINVNQFDVSQFFMEVEFDLGENQSVVLRGGRQEIVLGSARLVGMREPLNVRRGFDGLRIIAKAGAWRVDGLLVRPVQTKTGGFDDAPDRNQTFWGAYAIGPWQWVKGGGIDLYYLGLNRPSGRFDQGTAREVRHSVGTRLWGRHGGWDHSTEMVYQVGRFGEGNVRAWAGFTEVGYSPDLARVRPRFGLRAEVSSGDRNRLNPNLQTFNALYPRGAYLLEPALVGPFNHLLLDPMLEAKIRNKVRVIADAGFFWRYSLDDGLYTNAVVPERSGQASRSRYVGVQPELTVQWRMSQHLTWVGLLTHFTTGPFLRETGPVRPITYVATWISFTF